MYALSRLSLLATAGLLFTSPVTAQVALEVGVDAGVRVGANGTDVDVASVSFPVQSLRLGLHVFNRLSIENATAFDFVDANNTPNVTVFRTEFAGLYHVGSDRTRVRPYVRGGLSYRFVDVGDVSFGEFGIVGALGATAPLARRIAVRFQAGFDAQFDTRNEFSGLVGLSVFTG